MVLKMMPEFKKFLSFNNIDHDAIRYASSVMEYKYVEKGVYLFRQGDHSDIFYVIISGRISIRIEERVNSTSSKYIN